MKKQLALLLTLLLTLTATFASPQPAYAIGDTPLPNMPTTNDLVYAIAPDGAGGVYIGGAFTQLTPAGGGPAVNRNYIAHVNADGAIDAAWNPSANSSVHALAVSGSTVYAGGWFSSIGGQTRYHIAALDATTGDATPWNPNANSWVNTLAVSGSKVYAGGVFNNIGGQARQNIAALEATTGNATPWNPNADGMVLDLVVSGSTVYAGGLFRYIGGQTRNYIAALDAVTGNATTWNPNATNAVFDLAVSGSTVYMGGYFTTIGGAARNHIAALDTTTGNATTWNPNADNAVFDLAVSGSTVYAGGGFTTIGGAARSRIAALDTTTGNATAWNPNMNADVIALAVSGDTLYAGGYFTNIGGVSRPYFAAFGGLDTTPPSVAGQTLQSTYTGTGLSSFTVTFSENVNNAGSGALTDDAANPNNYVVMEQGAVSGFQTTACNAIDAAQDTRITPSGVTYASKTAVVNFGSPLPLGRYRLFVCGTTSIVDLAGNPLNNGVDSTFNFTVTASASGGGSSATGNGSGEKWLPYTGFAPSVVTRLPAQPAELAYTKMSDLWLEIPSQKVKANIVGVPQSANGWDVKWLGNDAGWLNGTAFPSWAGNSVITAHVMGADGLPGPFAKLQDLGYGERLIVHMLDQQYVFEIRNKRLVRPDTTAFAFEHLEDASYLTLVTCSGYNEEKNTYSFRRIVRAVLVEVK